VREQATRALTNDPVEDLRLGWDLHIAFGLAHPDAFALLYSAPSVAGSVSAIHEGVEVLQGLVARIAEAGRLRVDVAHATDLIHAAGTGVVLTLAAIPPDQRDPRMSESIREAILSAVTVPPSAEARGYRAAAAPGEQLSGGPHNAGPNVRSQVNESPNAAPAAARVAVHAVALRALLYDAANVLSPAEQQLLNDWLDRLATARSHAAGGLQLAYLDRGRV